MWGTSLKNPIYTISRTDLQMTPIGYGCMTIGGNWSTDPWTSSEYATGRKALAAALEQDITLFDHADIYTRGKSERLFGELLAEQPSLRQRIVLQSKCGIRFADEPAGSPQRYDFSYEHIVASVEGSLKRLNTDHLDLLLLHRPDMLVEPEDIARAFDQLQQSGKVRYFGVSNHSPAQIALTQAALDQPLVVNQVQLSLLHHQLISEGIDTNRSNLPFNAAFGLLDYCRLHKIQLQAWGPLSGGQLVNFNDDAPANVKATAALVNQLAEQYGVSSEAIQLAWLLRHPAQIMPIIGTTNPSRIAATKEALRVELNREEWYHLLTAARTANVP